MSYSQELIPNGSFENYSACPTQFGQLSRAIGWINPSIGGITNPGSPDFLHSCDTINNAGVPLNSVGYQFPHTGDGYAGIALWSPVAGLENFREYLECPIDTILEAGQCYHFKMYVNLANNVKFTTDAIGVYFSDTAIVDITDNYFLPYTAQITQPAGYFFDTLNWTMVSGNYVAHGGESYILVGNFNDFSNTSAAVANSTGTIQSAYVYVDDISLQLCTTGITEIPRVYSANIYPNPFTNSITIDIGIGQSGEIYIYDITSRCITYKKIKETLNFDTSFMSNGMYMFQLLTSNGQVKSGKIIKQ
ncbi:MAG: T9SS type A sorting domain-containing protein [Bacteroidia bacterium]|nr:T9SS type A sorting domain-containing protein [Bacteroidia bacterium]